MKTDTPRKRLPAEWEKQDGILLSWPHEDSDWKEWITLVEPVFIEIATWASLYERVVIVHPESVEVKSKLKKSGSNLKNIDFYTMPTNDTWARDFGPITVEEEDLLTHMDFGFNGWGLKFASNYDNLITRNLHQLGIFGKKNQIKTLGFILEGGSIESDGKGTILTTSECLLSPNRNPQFDREEICSKLKKYFGAERILWLNHGYLAGDDTDSHIDTLARLCPNNTIVYVRCEDKKDEHFVELEKMRKELEKFYTPEGNPYNLLALPFARVCLDSEGERMPATYANYLVINDAVLAPLYDDPENDKLALQVLQEAYPDRKIIGIDCRPLIIQHGSLHCVTMQLPEGSLRK